MQFIPTNNVRKKIKVKLIESAVLNNYDIGEF